MTPDPAHEDRVLSVEDVKALRFNASRAMQKCELGAHDVVAPETGETIGYCGKCGWSASLARVCDSEKRRSDAPVQPGACWRA